MHPGDLGAEVLKSGTHTPARNPRFVLPEPSSRRVFRTKAWCCSDSPRRLEACGWQQGCGRAAHPALMFWEFRQDRSRPGCA